ncbi:MULTISPECIES: DUF1289 domain-containing protein [unclassified Variovorax]|uniref:DUF1289 domain-containing protein n=1 Tax=unclassified Variovorax TaxID=663243 RepID=UPI003F45A94C
MNFGDAETLAERAVAVRGAANAVPSPCTSVCRMDKLSGLCEGCLRTIPEIAGWSKMDDEARRHVWRAIELRARDTANTGDTHA